MSAAEKGPGSPYAEGCGFQCCKTGVHTLVWGDCVRATPPPCAHPGFAWDDDMDLIRCTLCREFVGLMELVATAVEAGPGLYLGCSCWGDEKDGVHSSNCDSRPVAWRLNPLKVQDFVRTMPQALRHDPLVEVLLYAGRETDLTHQEFLE